MHNFYNNLQRNGGNLLKAAGAVVTPIAAASAPHLVASGTAAVTGTVAGGTVVAGGTTTGAATLAALATNPLTLPLAIGVGVVGVVGYLCLKD